MATQQCPNAVILDVDHSAEHQHLIYELAFRRIHCGIVVLTSSENPHFVRELYAMGSSAVLMKEQRNKESLIAAVQRVLSGDVWIDRRLLHSFLSRQDKGQRNGEASGNDEPYLESNLTHREQEVVQCLSKGYRNKRIAAELRISEATVRRHLTTIFNKLGVSDRLELLLYVHANPSLQPKPSIVSSPQYGA